MATISDLLIKIGADSSGLQNELKKSKDSINKAFGDTSNVDAFGNAVDSLTGKLAAFASAGAAIETFKKMTKAAMDFESAMADVKKVVDFDTPTQFSDMQKDILELTKTLPMTAKEISQIVAAGGQAGIAKGDLMEFAEAAAKMGTAFDITADQAGDMMAKWRSAFKMAQPEVEELADKINFLGNTTAASAPLISDVVTRIGPLGAVGGVASGEIAALGASMIGTGVQSEVAATGIKNMILALVSGESATKSQADAFAALGFNAADMSKRMQEDARGAILDVLDAINQLPKDQQGSVLKNLFGSESIGAIAPLLTNLDALKENLNKVGDSSQYAGSMQQEFDARCETTENALKLTENAVERTAIALGSVFLPYVKEAAEGIANNIDWLTKWVDEHKELCQTVGMAAGYILTLVAAGKAWAVVLGGVTSAQAALRTLTGGAQIAKEAELTAAQEKAIAKRMRNMETEANHQIKLYAKEVQQKQITEVEKNRLVTEYAAQRQLTLEKEQLAARTMMSETFLQANAMRQKDLTSHVTAEAEKQVATQKTTVVLGEQALAHGAVATRAAGAAGVIASASSVARSGVMRLTSAVWDLAGGWLGVAFAIGLAVKAAAEQSQVNVAEANKQFITLANGETVTKNANGDYVGVYDPDAARAATYGDSMASGDDYDPGSGDYGSSSYAGEDGEGDGCGATTSEPANNYYELDEAKQAEAYGKDPDRPITYAEWYNGDTPEAKAERARQEANAEMERMANETKNLGFGGGIIDPGIGDDLSAAAGSLSDASGSLKSAAETIQDYTVDVPIGETVADYASANSDGQIADQEMEDLVQNLGPAGLRCAAFASSVYQATGVMDHLTASGDDLAQQFKDAGAYHDADSGYVPQAGDLIDFPSHVGIVGKNGLTVISRQGSNGEDHGTHEVSMADAYDWFGSPLGFGSVAEYTGGKTVSQTYSGTSADMAAQRKADDAMKKYQDAVQRMNQMSNEMMSAIHSENDTKYQTEYANAISDINKKHQELNKIKAAGVDTTKAENILTQYQETQLQKIADAQKKAYNEQVLASRQAKAEAVNDYKELAQVEYDSTIAKLEEERKAKIKEVAQTKDDYEALAAVNDEYYAKRMTALQKYLNDVRDAYNRKISALTDLGDIDALRQYLNSSEGQNDTRDYMDMSGRQEQAKAYVEMWKESHRDIHSYLAEASGEFYNTLTDDMTAFIRGTKSAKEVMKDFFSSVMSMIAKMAAQRLAANWVTGLLGMFGGRSSAAPVGNFGISSTSITDSLMSSVSPASLFSVPKMASGGIVTAPTLAMIGEGGSHEAVIPLNDSNLRAMSGSNSRGGVVVNITNRSDSQVEVKNSQYDEGMQKWILDVVVDGAQRNKGGFNTNLKTALGAK